MRKPIRLQHLLTIAAIVACSSANAQNVGISADGATPNAAAILDIDVSSLAVKRGLLIPRMTEAQRLTIPVTAADDALLVYQTDLGTAPDNTNARGFWYYDALATPAPLWKHLSTARQGWYLRGNTLLGSGAAEYLGTTTTTVNNILIFRTQPAPANPAMQIGYALTYPQAGFVGLGTAAPATERLEVQGAIRMAPPVTPNWGGTTNMAGANIVEGTIRYGTETGATPTNANPKYHWGTTVQPNGTKQWSRLENAEERVLTKPYLKDTLSCAAGINPGNAMRGQLSTVPVTQTTATPCNVYSPFASNFANNVTGNYRVQYLYRSDELLATGLCFPTSITEISFFCLDQENLINPGNVVTTLEGELRAAVPNAASFLNTPSAYFGAGHTSPYMAQNVMTSTIQNSFNITPSPGWITFPLANTIVLNAGDNLIIDVVWSRSTRTGVGPKVELEDPGFLCTKWVFQSGGGGTQAARNLVKDNPVTGTVAPTTINPHTKRPVTRFTGKIAGPTTISRIANLINYGGSIMIGDAAWEAASTKRGRGTVMAQNGIYDGNILLSDHVFDRYFDGAVRPEDGQATMGYAYVGLAKLRERLEQDRHLPNMPSRSEWEAKGGASLGTITTGLWQSVEDQALYITQLEQDLDALEEMTFGTAVGPEEAQRLIAGIQASKRLTEAQKLHLIDALNAKATPAPAKP